MVIRADEVLLGDRLVAPRELAGLVVTDAWTGRHGVIVLRARHGDSDDVELRHRPATRLLVDRETGSPCGWCGEPGHMSDTCPDRRGVVAEP